jgi:hypothetical protein
MTEPIRPDHYGNSGTDHDLIGHWLSIGAYAAVWAPIQKYVERAGQKPGEPMLKDLYKASEYLDRWIEFEEGKQ